MPHYRFVEQPDSLAPSLTAYGRVGVDTEFMREKTYFAQLCLVQIATSKDIYCVDPLTDSSKKTFWQELLASDWVVHSARQDIEVVYQTAGSMPASIFDKSSTSSIKPSKCCPAVLMRPRSSLILSRPLSRASSTSISL